MEKEVVESYAGNNTINVHDNGFELGSTSTGTYMVDQYFPKEVKDVKITEETIEITYVQRARFTYTTNVNIGNTFYCDDRTFKEIYGTRDGKLTLLKTIQGKVIPAHTVEESFEFDE